MSFERRTRPRRALGTVSRTARSSLLVYLGLVNTARSNPVARRSALALWAVAVVLSSCASLGRAAFAPPQVSLSEVQLLGIGLSGGTLNLVLAVHNPNAYQITGGRLEAEVAFEETQFGEIAIERVLTLPAHDTTRVEVPLRFSWQGVGAGARAFLQRGSVSYVLTGSLIAETPVGEHSVPVRTTGTVTLRDLM